jgi:UDP:flavonoid glycosyltransferase YjiC (YdhE family)
MIISVLASGSRGDVQPPAALATSLALRGHSVRLLANDVFADLVAGRGVEFKPLGLDIRAELESEDARRYFVDGRNPVALWRWFFSVARRYAREIAPKALDYIAGSDLLVGAGLMGPFAMMAARRWNKPCVHAWMQPTFASRDFLTPYLPPPALDLPGWLNVALNASVDQASWLVMRSILRVAHDLVGLPPPSFRSPLPQAVRAGEKLLQAYSKAILPPGSDWPSNVEVTGYWFLDRAGDWRPPDDLLSFIEAGPPPVYIGFGSMVLREPRATFQTALQAIRKINCRAVISLGWSGMQPEELPEGVIAIADAPHDWLFPRMTAIVHHGGAGTTGAALRAGLPSVAAPFVTDQFFWARQMYKQGVAPRAIPHRNLTSDALADAISIALGDRTMRKRAAEVGAIVRSEDGVDGAIAAIEQAAR